MNQKQPNPKDKRDYFSDKELKESGPANPKRNNDRTEGNTRAQKGPCNTGMDYFEEGAGNPEKENQLGSPGKKRRKRAA